MGYALDGTRQHIRTSVHRSRLAKEKQKIQGGKESMSYEITQVIDYTISPPHQQKSLWFDKKEIEKD